VAAAWLPELRLPEERRGVATRLAASAEGVVLLLGGASPTEMTRWRGAAVFEPGARALDDDWAAPLRSLEGRAELCGFRLLGARLLGVGLLGARLLGGRRELDAAAVGAVSASPAVRVGATTLASDERLSRGSASARGAARSPTGPSLRLVTSVPDLTVTEVRSAAEGPACGALEETLLESLGAGEGALDAGALLARPFGGASSAAAAAGGGAMRSMVASSLPSRSSNAMARCCSRIRRCTSAARSGWPTYSA
jgi:hypothetical protein